MLWSVSEILTDDKSNVWSLSVPEIVTDDKSNVLSDFARINPSDSASRTVYVLTVPVSRTSWRDDKCQMWISVFRKSRLRRHGVKRCFCCFMTSWQYDKVKCFKQILSNIFPSVVGTPVLTDDKSNVLSVFGNRPTLFRQNVKRF